MPPAVGFISTLAYRPAARAGLAPEVFGRLDAEIQALAYGEVGRRRGSVSAEHGIGVDRKPVLGLSKSPREIDLMRRIKAALDPQGLMNPGKIFDQSAALK